MEIVSWPLITATSLHAPYSYVVTPSTYTSTNNRLNRNDSRRPPILMTKMIPCQFIFNYIKKPRSNSYRATILAKLTYCSPAWSGYCTAADVGRLDSFLRKCRRLGYCEQSQPSIAELYSDIDDALFSRIMSNSKHTLQQFLHDHTTTYSLRSRNHSKVLVNTTSYLNHSDFK